LGNCSITFFNVKLCTIIIKGAKMINERDKFLTEFIGECYHEKISFLRTSPQYYRDEKISDWRDYAECDVCHEYLGWEGPNEFSYRNDFSTSKCFFKLWNFSITKDWWHSFLAFVMFKFKMKAPEFIFHGLTQLINPTQFADLLYDFLKREGIK
jgi:hypothetical protein